MWIKSLIERFDKATASIVSDAQQTWAINSTSRNIVRAVLVVIIAGVTAALVSYKYVTESPLRDSAFTTREQNVKNLSQDIIEKSVCPCREESLSYGDFVRVSPQLDLNDNSLYNLCETLIVPELADVTSPTMDSSPADKQAYANAQSAILRDIGAITSCGIALVQIVIALSPDPRLQFLAEKLVTSDLLSERQARLRLDTFIGAKILQTKQDYTSQLLLQQVVLGNLRFKISDFLTQAQLQSNDTAFLTALSATAYQFSLFYNVTANTNVALEAATTGVAGFIQRLTKGLERAVIINYEDYVNACSPPYCDFTQVKTVQARIVEFFAVLGGVYTTVLGTGVFIWVFIGLFLRGNASLSRASSVSAGLGK